MQPARKRFSPEATPPCFENAILHVSRNAGLKFTDEDVKVVAEIGLSRNESGGFVLSAALAVAIAGVDQMKAEELVAAAHKICPYSNAIQGNIDVGFTITARESKLRHSTHQYYVRQTCD